MFWGTCRAGQSYEKKIVTGSPPRDSTQTSQIGLQHRQGNIRICYFCLEERTEIQLRNSQVSRVLFISLLLNSTSNYFLVRENSNFIFPQDMSRWWSSAVLGEQNAHAWESILLKVLNGSKVSERKNFCNFVRSISWMKWWYYIYTQPISLARPRTKTTNWIYIKNYMSV